MAAFPPWTGVNFVKTLHHTVPGNLKPALQSLKSPFVVCITGGSRGIGAETAKAFAEAGATGLILTARTEAALEKTRDSCQAVAKSQDLKISTIGADAGSAVSAQHLARIVKEEHGRLDVLVNNAGIMATDPSAFGKLDVMEDNQFNDIMQVNYIGRFHIIKQLLPIMLQSSNGAKAIMNITSFSSHLTGGTPVGFNISELANNRFAEAVAEMYSEEGIMAYAVHPGMVGGAFPDGFPEGFKQFATDDPGLCGAFLVWLVNEKRDWLSGRYLSANWDVTELESMKDEILKGDKLKMRMVV